MHRYLIILEQNSDSFSAYSPDLPGCVAHGASRQEAETNMTRAVQSHIRWLLEQGLPIPEARSIAEYVAVQEGNDS